MTDAISAAYDPAAHEQLTVTRHYRQPIEQVWAAITTPQRIADWMGVTFDPAPETPLQVGSSFTYRMGDFEIESVGEVLALEPPHLFRHSWFTNVQPGQIVTWRLAPEGHGCRLTLSQHFPGPDDASRTASGWSHLLGNLAVVLGEPADPTPAPAYRERYLEAFPKSSRKDGTLNRLPDGQVEVRFERWLRQPVAKVWAALTEPERLAEWLGRVDIRPEVGGPFHIRFNQPGDYRMDGQITAIDPPHRLSMIWREPWFKDDAVTLHFELEAAEGGTHLTLTHLFPADYDPFDYLAGWHDFMDALERALDGTSTDWSAGHLKVRYQALEAIYRMTVPKPEPITG